MYQGLCARAEGSAAGPRAQPCGPARGSRRAPTRVVARAAPCWRSAGEGPKVYALTMLVPELVREAAHVQPPAADYKDLVREAIPPFLKTSKTCCPHLVVQREVLHGGGHRLARLSAQPHHLETRLVHLRGAGEGREARQSICCSLSCHVAQTPPKPLLATRNAAHAPLSTPFHAPGAPAYPPPHWMRNPPPPAYYRHAAEQLIHTFTHT